MISIAAATFALASVAALVSGLATGLGNVQPAGTNNGEGSEEVRKPEVLPAE